MNLTELSKVYAPHEVEDRWIQIWIEKNYFKASPLNSGKKPYSIVIPPPNVTGSLHMGHALNSTIQDILVRYHRMKGDNTLWVVGTDHAGIATQNVVERQLKEEGKTRFDLGREKFVERVWKWRHESGGTIIGQLKRLGASCDYSNERFTMDEGLSQAVRKVFVQLYEDGLIYRGLRLINWCPRCQTALSDLEVEYTDEAGFLWHIRYPLSKNGEADVEFLVVATTRPETLLGDSAVAIHPEDPRYQSWIGQKVLLPLVNREIPVIADSYVDRAFGSGVVKITPAHDFNDFTIGERHSLEQINILTPDGKINEKGGPYAHLTLTKAREKIVEDLTAGELLEKVEAYKHAVGHCYRCKSVVEPYLSDQWFVKTKPLADKAIKAVKDGETRFIPGHWEKTYFSWMENIQDWCISRQIWWGHQIPAWYCENFANPKAQKTCGPIVSETEPTKCPQCSSVKLTQDPDVLDTWFSSALWPFSTLGWPTITPELKMFYPTSVLVTAFDIIFFWVARMMMMGIHFMHQVPFKDVHIHALVRDPMGQKMSKSKGNVVDPLIMMTKYGTDAFRFTLAALAAQGRDIKLDENRIEGYRNFCNKIWNASRFALMSASPFVHEESDFKEATPQNRINQWILFELSTTIEKVRTSIENYEFNKAALTLYRFFWNYFCDWYLELTKEIYKGDQEEQKKETAKTTFFVLDTSLKLLHPFMPFLTEEIWQMLGERSNTSICIQSFPTPFNDKKVSTYVQSAKEVELLIEVISSIRAMRQETGVSLSEKLQVKIIASGETLKLYQQITPMILQLGGVKELEFISEDPKEPAAIARAGDSLIIIPFQGLIDAKKELERQTKKIEKVNKDIGLLRQRLDDPKFVENAEAELIAEKREQLKIALEQKDLVEKALKLLVS